MTPLRALLAVVVVVVIGAAIIGIGTGGPVKGDAAPMGKALVASKQRIATGGAMVKDGAKEFASEGCDDCHAIAATGAKGNIGPRLDTDTDPVHETVENILEPRKDIAKGYPAKLMPTDYAKRMPRADIQAIAAFIHAASGSGGGD